MPILAFTTQRPNSKVHLNLFKTRWSSANNTARRVGLRVNGHLVVLQAHHVPPVQMLRRSHGIAFLIGRNKQIHCGVEDIGRPVLQSVEVELTQIMLYDPLFTSSGSIHTWREPPNVPE